MDELLADFLTETHEGLAALDDALLRLERVPEDRQTLSEVFRLVHTIKGTCGFLGLPRLERVAHAAENVLGRYRDGQLPVTSAGVTLILSALDRVKLIVAGIASTGTEAEGDDAALLHALNEAYEGRLAEPRGAGTRESGATETAAAPSPEPAAEAPDATPVAAQQTIRVSVEVLEELMVLVSELVLTRNQLLQSVRGRDDAALSVPLQRLSHITSDLQEGVMKTRMQPIGNAWQKLPRLVRDLSRELGKRIELEMRGAETELDRQVLEMIRDPLTHMVRNSADHGLETAEQRRAAGKPDTGRILLNAYHEGGHIVMEVGDDGRGLALERIRAKALSQGLVTEAELAAMSERDVQRLIFHPGFSTAAAVTAVSGRGVGMDVVKTNIERIGGTVEVRSREGKGSTFVVKIPLTLAIVSALVVQAGSERFAIPQIGVLELVRVGSSGARIERIKDAAVLRLRDRLLPLVSLSGLLRLDGGAGEDGGFVVVTQLGSDLFGIIVDRIFDAEEIVVKPVAPILRHLTVFSGNTILGDGTVIMIADPAGIARAAGIGGDRGLEAERKPAPARTTSTASALLLFTAGDATPKTVPLALVSRLEDIPAERIEVSGGRWMTQYRGRLMPLVPLSPGWSPGHAGTRQAVLVFTEHDRVMGLMVDSILDVVEERLRIEQASTCPGYLGTAVIAGRATEVLDCAWWLEQGGEGWFETAAARTRLLLVEDSAFFRGVVGPMLSAAGYQVTAVANGAEALRLREAEESFDAIVSDIEMPELGGIELARTLRQGGAWAGLPMIALSSRTTPEAIRQAREAGFTDYVGKLDREGLLASLRQCLGTPTQWPAMATE
ncbi:chemotaxis protein CheW [Roseomonas gilardii subsp. gilardii]|uniref:hybrid sensor histidine kinase/response regulator n=1 Tax=Roseomonas gilardii TaxID=257708 RepID=UPI001FF79996|nr:chemotaxis protein CheW [Roseomonas gilardii]UPG71016.1 chemotaxis protein CheW [Roseomonas gilardii subsp. gilardii]